MTDAVEAVGQAVQQEAADELVRSERHLPGRVAVGVIAPAEGHACLVGADQAAVGDGDTVGIPAEIGEDMLGRTERRLGIDDPALLAQRAQCLGKVASSRSRNSRRNSRERTWIGRKKRGRQASQRPSGESAPPGTRQWMCG